MGQASTEQPTDTLPVENTETIERLVDIRRVNAKQHKVMGVVYAPDVPDSYDDYMAAEEIVKAADFFMASHQNIDEMHDFIGGVGFVAQSFIARAGDPDFAEGAWVLEVKVLNEDVWKKVVNGEYKAFSFAGSAKRGKETTLESQWVDADGNRTSPYAKEA